MDDVTNARATADDVVTVRYWAGARAAAGVETEQLAARDVATLRRAAVAAHEGLADVLPRCSVLVNGARCEDTHVLSGGDVAEILPPFAGG